MRYITGGKRTSWDLRAKKHAGRGQETFERTSLIEGSVSRIEQGIESIIGRRRSWLAKPQTNEKAATGRQVADLEELVGEREGKSCQRKWVETQGTFS